MRITQAGFTILEVLVALAILTVGSTCVVALYSAALETYRRGHLEFVATNLAVEILDTGEDLLAHGAVLETLPAAIKKRIALPPRFIFDLTFEEIGESGVNLKVRVSQEGRGKTRRWQWRRVVLRGAGNRVVDVPREPPRRYRYRRRGVVTGR